MEAIAAYLAVIILMALTIFQIALIAGAPLGEYAWGGQHKILPTKLRVASCSSILLYLLFMLVALAKAGIVLEQPSAMVSVLCWMIAGYSTLGIGLNAISRSQKEKLVMTPIATSLAILFLVIAAS